MSFTLIGIWPNPCIPSMIYVTPRSLQMFPIAPISVTEPLAAITQLKLTALVRASIWFLISSVGILPLTVCTILTSTPSCSRFSQGYILEGNSMSETITLSPAFNSRAFAAKFNPIEVFWIKNISFAWAPIFFAINSLQCSVVCQYLSYSGPASLRRQLYLLIAFITGAGIYESAALSKLITSLRIPILRISSLISLITASCFKLLFTFSLY